MTPMVKGTRTQRLFHVSRDSDASKRVNIWHSGRWLILWTVMLHRMCVALSKPFEAT